MNDRCVPRVPTYHGLRVPLVWLAECVFRRSKRSDCIEAIGGQGARGCLVLILAVLLCAPLCARKKSKAPSPPEVNEADEDTVPSNAVEGDRGTAINMPQRERTYFSDVDSNILRMVEIGSPPMLRAAVSAIQMKEQTEKEQVLLSVADSVMRLVWPSEKTSWKVPAVNADTPYTGALQSAQNGIYDTSTGNTDFLTYVLPSAVVAAGTQVSTYAEKAESALQKGLSLRADSVLAQYLLGLLYTKTGRDNDALPLLQKAYAAYDGKEVSFALANTLGALGRKEEAARLSQILAQRWPEDLEVLKACARSAYSLKDYGAAEGYVSKLLQQDPHNTEFILLRAKILVAMGDYIRATSMLDLYSRQDNTSKDYLMLRAQVQRDWSGNLSAAATTAADALTRYPKDPLVLLLAASLAAATGGTINGRTASSLSEEALQIDPDNEEAMKYKINALVEAYEWQKAYKESAWYIRNHMTDRDAVFTHIRICLEVKRNDEAWSIISPIYKEHNDDEAVVRSYVTVLVRTGRTAEALSIINGALSTATSAMRSFYYYQRSLMQTSQEAALADLRSALIALPRNKDALFRLYQIYYDNRDYRKAQYYLKQVIALDRNNAAMRRLDDDLSRLVQ